MEAGGETASSRDIFKEYNPLEEPFLFGVEMGLDLLRHLSFAKAYIFLYGSNWKKIETFLI